MSDDKVKMIFNGHEIEVAKGTTLIQAAKDRGIDIPTFCYHEGLEKSGYCRMCLVEVDTPRGKRLITSCNTPCTEGGQCDTDSENAKRGRKAVLEFYLVNHPLDCPECDKAGECDLQNNSYDHGNAKSRARLEDKIVKKRKEFGDKIRFYSQRCVACRRCTQFLNDVSGTKELAFVDRGAHQELDIFPGKPIHNSLAKNIVDVCPVGALIDKDFQYTARPWLMRSTESVCAGCSKGCAVTVDHKDEKALRFKGRFDAEVNGHWICDHGRDTVKRLEISRHSQALVGGEVVSVAKAREKAVSLLSQGFSLLASAFNTQDEIEVALEMAAKNSVGAIARADGEEEEFPGFVIPADKNPNRAGVAKLLGDKAFDEQETIKNLERVNTLLILNAVPEYQISDALFAALKKVNNIVLLEAWKTPLSEIATVTLPSAAATEKDGTFINDGGVERQLSFCVPAPGYAEMDLEILKTLNKALRRVAAV